MKEAVLLALVVEVEGAEDLGSEQNVDKMMIATAEPREGLAKTEKPSHQFDSGEVNEQCGRLGLPLELSIFEMSEFRH